MCGGDMTGVPELGSEEWQSQCNEEASFLSTFAGALARATDKIADNDLHADARMLLAGVIDSVVTGLGVHATDTIVPADGMRFLFMYETCCDMIDVAPLVISVVTPAGREKEVLGASYTLRHNLLAE